jgi:hypothetical protein
MTVIRTTTSPEPFTRLTESTNALQERIRRRAHELFEQRGGAHGLASDDWYQAEAEIMASPERPKGKAAKASK